MVLAISIYYKDKCNHMTVGLESVIHSVPPGHGKSWNLGRPFSRPGKSWKIAKVMEKSWKMMIMSNGIFSTALSNSVKVTRLHL